MFSTLEDTFTERLLNFRDLYLSDKSVQNLISKNRFLSDALEYLDSRVEEISRFQSWTGFLWRGASRLAMFESARDFLGEVLDDLEAEEDPTQITGPSEVMSSVGGDPGHDGDPKRIAIDGNRADVDGTLHVLEDSESAFLRGLVKAGPGHWIAGSEMETSAQPRPDRIHKKMRSKYRWVEAFIEAEAGKGFRLKSDVATSSNAKIRP
jgi:hypothetical protein